LAPSGPESEPDESNANVEAEESTENNNGEGDE
jgi:hypothetical protein